MNPICLSQEDRIRPHLPRAAASDDPMLRLLERMPLLEAAARPSLRRLAAATQVREYPPGAAVFARGSEPTGLFFVVEGGVKLVAMGPDRRSRVVELFERGRMFGEIGVFTGQTYRTWTETTATTTLLHVDKAAVLETIARDHDLTRRMLDAVTARTQRLIDAIGVASPNTADVRIAAYLLDLAAPLEHSGEREPRLTLPATKGTIASLLNLTQESLSRTLRRMRDAGLIKVAGRRIQICAPLRLRELAGR